MTVTNNAGNQSAGSLGAAVTGLNSLGPGNIYFQSAINPITLTQPLPALTQNATFLGPGDTIWAQSNSQSLFQFQQAFTLYNGIALNFANNGLAGPGLDVAVSASSFTMLTNSGFSLTGGSGPATSLSGGSGVIGTAAGSAAVTAGPILMNSIIGGFIQGGTGGAVTDTNGSGDSGGTGGKAVLNASSMSVSFSIFSILGGAGGAATDLGTGSPTGGTGGAVAVSIGNLSEGSNSLLIMNGGNGGFGTTGGAGGQAIAILGSANLTLSNANLNGGNGADGVSNGGLGGSASATITSLSLAPNANFSVAGGHGGVGQSGGAKGGDAFAGGGGVTVTGTNTTFRVAGGAGGNVGPTAGPANGGNGGNAGVSLNYLEVDTGSLLYLTGGNGGQGGSGAAPGTGGLGGNSTLTAGTFSVGVSVQLSLSAGSGGTGGQANAGGTGGAGGAAGYVALTATTLSLSAGSNLSLGGGSGGGGGNVVSGGTGGNGANGGNVNLVAAAVTLASGSQLNVNGGSGGSGGSAAANGSNGTAGNAFASISTLTGSGTLFLSGNSALCQINDGNFGGTLLGATALQKLSAGVLTLSGANNYNGGTSIMGGALVVDTGGALGTGGVQVNSGTILNYVHSSTAANSAVTVASGGALQFWDNSTAASAFITNSGNMNFIGSATAGNAQINDTGTLVFQGTSSAGSAAVTVQNGGSVFFSVSATGGTSAFELATGSSFSISSANGAVTVGSVDGSGAINLGPNALAEGTNNASTTVSGFISGTGSITKLGTGTWTLTQAVTTIFNNYSGGTLVNAGILLVGYPTALGTGSLAVNGGTFGTAGYLANPVQVGNSYTQGANGTLRLGVGGASAINHDWIAVTGNAALNGTLNIFSYGALTAPPIGQKRVILTTTGTVTGMFQQVQENLVASVRLLPVYFPSLVELESINPSFSQSGATPNQRAIGADLDAVFLNPQVNSLAAALGALSNSDLQAAYAQISPEDLTSLYQVGFASSLSRSALVEDRLFQFQAEAQGKGRLSGKFPEEADGPWFAGLVPVVEEAAMVHHGENDWSGFVSGNGGLFNVAADGNAAGYKAASYGLSGAGADVRLSKDLAAGLLAGYGHTDVTLGTGGQVTDDGGQLGLYGLLSSSGFFADVLVEGGIHSYKSRRLSYGGLAVGQAQGQEYDGAVELGYQWKQNQVQVGPLASVQYTTLNVGGFTEQGSQANISFPAQSTDSLLMRLGVAANGQWKLDTMSLNPFLRLAFEHEFDYQGGTVQAGFGTGDNFTVAGPQIGQNGLLVGAGVELAFSKDFAASLHYQGELGRTNLTSNQAGGGIRFGF